MKDKIWRIFFAIVLLLIIPLHVLADDDQIVLNEEIQNQETTEEYENSDEKKLVDYQNNETNYSLLIEDDANLLSEDEKEKLMEDMVPLTKYGNIYFKSTHENEYYSTSELAEASYLNQFGSTNGTIFVIDMFEREIYIYSYGLNYDVITDTKAEIITDNVYRYASKKEYYICSSKAYEQMYSILSGEKIKEPMRDISSIFLALATGFFINFLYIFKSSNAKQATNEAILQNCTIAFAASNIKGIKVGTHKVYNPPSDSGSSGGGGGGGGSSGGGGGGGGGHGF